MHQLVERTCSLLSEIRRQEIAIRARFADQHRTSLPHWAVLTAFNDYPPSAVVQPRPFDVALPDLSPTHFQRLQQNLDAAARDTPYASLLEKWSSPATAEDGNGEDDTVNAGLQLERSLDHAAAMAQEALESARQEASSTGARQSVAPSESVAELQRQLLVLHTECHMWQQMAMQAQARSAASQGAASAAVDADLELADMTSSLPAFQLPLPAVDAVLSPAAGQSTARGDGGGTAAAPSADSDNATIRELQSRCAGLQAQVQQLQQAMASKTQEMDDLEMELASSRIKSVPRERTSGSISENEEALALALDAGDSVSSSDKDLGSEAQAVVPKISVGNFKVGDVCFFVRSKRSSKPLFKAIRVAGNPAVVLPSKRCQEKGLADR